MSESERKDGVIKQEEVVSILSFEVFPNAFIRINILLISKFIIVHDILLKYEKETNFIKIRMPENISFQNIDDHWLIDEHLQKKITECDWIMKLLKEIP